MEPTTTTTAPATDIPAAPAEKPADLSQLERQLKSKPSLPKTDFKALSEIPDAAVSPTPAGVDVVPEQNVQDFLKSIENKKNTGPIEEEPKKEEKVAEKVDFSIDDLDLSKDPEPVVEEEKPKKKSKEDNIAELRKKAEAFEIEAKTKEEKLSEYQRKLEELEETLEKTAFEKSPKFREKFQAPFEESVGNVVNFAKEFADDASIAEKALSLKGKERIEFIDETFGGGAASARFLSLVEDADSKRNSLERAVENHRQTNQTFQQEEVAQKEEVNKRINTTFDRVRNHLATKSEFFRIIDGDDDHNSVVNKRVEAARNIILGNASENDMAVAPFLAVIAKDAVEKVSKLEAELAKYKARAAKDASVTPAPRRGTSDTNETTGKPKGALDSIKSYFR